MCLDLLYIDSIARFFIDDIIHIMIIVKYIVVPARQPSPAPLDVSTVLKSAQVR